MPRIYTHGSGRMAQERLRGFGLPCSCAAQVQKPLSCELGREHPPACLPSSRFISKGEERANQTAAPWDPPKRHPPCHSTGQKPSSEKWGRGAGGWGAQPQVDTEPFFWRRSRYPPGSAGSDTETAGAFGNEPGDTFAVKWNLLKGIRRFFRQYPCDTVMG